MIPLCSLKKKKENQNKKEKEKEKTKQKQKTKTKLALSAPPTMRMSTFIQRYAWREIGYASSGVLNATKSNLPMNIHKLYQVSLCRHQIQIPTSIPDDTSIRIYYGWTGEKTRHGIVYKIMNAYECSATNIFMR